MKFWIVVICLGASQMAIRAIGPLLFARRQLPGWALGPFALLTPVVLAALSMVATFGAGRHLAVDARAAGVAAAVICVAIRAPLLVVMVTAAAVTGLTRWLL